MATNYVDLPTLKLAIGESQTDRDDLLNRALSSASRMVDRTTGRRFDLDATATARTYLPQENALRMASGDLLRVDDIGSTTGLIVETGTSSGGWTAVTDYETTPLNALAGDRPVTGIVLPAGYWPRSSTSRVRVTARWGWPAVPDDIVQATLIQAIRLYKRKDSPEGVAGSAEWGVIRMSRVDPDVRELLSPFMLAGFR